MTENSPALWLAQFPRLKADGNKYDRGIAVIAGGAEMTGAACLAARAAQRAGAGLVWMHAPMGRSDLYRLKLDSCIIKEQPWAEVLAEAKISAACIGPGYGRSAQTREAVLQLLARRIPCVLDADALSSFEQHRAELFAALHSNVVLTPHGGEFARLFDSADAAAAAKQSGAIVLLKGQHTQIAGPDGRVAINNNAPPELATAGSGDVLAGLITGLLAQGMPTFEAACAGAWLHGAAASAFGPGLIAEDLLAMLPAVLRGLFVTKS